jgi:hypothetical protein
MASMETVYLNRNPTAKAILELVQSVDGEQICYDHLAFRTFGVLFVFNFGHFAHYYYYYYTFCVVMYKFSFFWNILGERLWY